MFLFAVHISDGILTTPWIAGGFAIAYVLVLFGSLCIRDEEIPRIALLTAAFFVASLLHARVGPTSVQLLLNGLVGVILGRRAALALLVGLFLQVALLGHGGFLTLGVNTCVMTLPALFSFVLFRTLHRIPWIKTPTGRGILVAVGAAVWFLSGVYSLTLLFNTSISALDDAALEIANARLLDPFVIGGMLLFTVVMIGVERRLENTPEFPLGFLIGELSVLMTVVLNCAVLLAGGERNWPVPPLVLVIAHLPFAVIEGVILGFVIGFLAKVKPEMLGIVNHGGHARLSEPEA